MIKEQHLRQAKISSYTRFSQPPISRSGYVTYRALHATGTDARLILPSAPFIPTDGSHSQSMSGDQPHRPK